MSSWRHCQGEVKITKFTARCYNKLEYTVHEVRFINTFVQTDRFARSEWVLGLWWKAFQSPNNRTYFFRDFDVLFVIVLLCILKMPFVYAHPHVCSVCVSVRAYSPHNLLATRKTSILLPGRYVDDTLTVMPDLTTATTFLHTLNSTHISVKFTMEVEKNGKRSFLGTVHLGLKPRFMWNQQTQVYYYIIKAMWTIATNGAYWQLSLIAHTNYLPPGPFSLKSVIGLRKFSSTINTLLKPIYTVRLCRIRQAYDRPTTWIVSCKSNQQFAYDCRVRPESCRGLVLSLLYATKSHGV